MGFTPGSQLQGQYTVNRTNTHAWPEVYFGGYGWVRFEPTKDGPAGVGAPGWAPGGPSVEVANRINELPRDKTIVAYCS